MPKTKFTSDDIVYTKTLQEHIIAVKKLFENLRDLILKLSRKKYVFASKDLSLGSFYQTKGYNLIRTS